MKATLDQYQADFAKQPDKMQLHIRRGEALGRLLLWLADYLRRIYRWVARGAHAHSRSEAQQPAVHGASVLDVKPREQKAEAQAGNAQAANDQNYKSAA
jgi:hypothetical protein